MPDLALDRYAQSGAVGLLVPGAGPEVSRAGALAALERARVRSSFADDVTVYVTLPPPGRHHNVRRYPVAIVGGGYRGLLVSRSTRIPGLVTIEDIAGRPPLVRSRADDDAPATLRRLDRRLTRAHDARGWADVVLIAAMLLGILLSRRLPALAVLAAPAALAAALLLSALDSTSVLALAALTAAAVLACVLLPTGPVLAAFFAGLLVVLAVWPEVNSLAVIGPHPDGGGRFYGVTNQVETLLLAAALAAATALGAHWVVPFGALALVTVGASRTGADGGGALVLAVGLLVLALRLRGLALSPRRLAIVGAAAVALGLGLVAIDAALGGSSHVTRAVGGGPGSLAGELAHRLHVSYEGATRSWGAGAGFLAGIAGLAFLATRRPRYPAVDACLLALAASLLVNDTPTDVAGFGALACAGLLVWERSRSSTLAR